MKKRILQLVTRSDWAGVQKVVYSIAYGLMKYYPNEFEVEVACGPENGMLIPELRNIGIEVHVLKHLKREISPVNDIKVYFEIKNLIRMRKYDIVHAHSSKVRVLGGLVAKKLGVKKVIYTYHGFWHIKRHGKIKQKLLILFEKVAARYCDRLVLLCKREVETAKEWKLGERDKYVIIPNAIVTEPPASKGLLRKELGISGNIKIVGNVARLDLQKNPMRFLKVAKNVLSQRKDVVFVWIGGSVVEDICGKRVQEWLKKNPEVAERIFLLPFRKDATKLMADFDVFLLTSDDEGMPLVVLEALSQGVPVVSTDVGCVGEMVKHIGKDEKELTRQVLDVLRDSHNRGFVSSNKWNFDDFIHNHAKIYMSN